MKIVVDAMGGDLAPGVVVEGAVLANREHGVESILVGNPSKIENEILRLGAKNIAFDIRKADQIIQMGETPARVLKSKPDSSMWVAAEILKQGEAKAVFSAGDTGGAFAVSLHILKRLKGVLRPAIAALIPTLNGFSVMLDVGANLVPSAQQLFQFGIMGAVYSELVLGKSNPTVGLLNVGGENSKGTDTLKVAHQLFSKSHLNFSGNAEGSMLFQGTFDVIVCDGFSGNVALKVSESLSEMMGTVLRSEVSHSLRSKIGYMFMQNGIKSIKKRMDYSEYGGAPLLGLNGLCMIGHGRSSAKAVKNALRTSADIAGKDLNQKIQEQIDAHIEIQRTADRGWRLWSQISGGMMHGSQSEESDKEDTVKLD